MDYNKVALTGRLTRYREVRYTLAGGNQKTDCQSLSGERPLQPAATT